VNQVSPEPAPARWADALRTTKRDLLLSAARDEFADKGLQRASMRGIAARAGCTTGALYPLFRSKEALYSSLLEQSLTDLDEAVRTAVELAPAGREAVTAGCRAFVRYYLEHQFEVNLGLYAFQGVRRQGVGKQSDRILNEALLRVLGRLTTPLEGLLGLSSRRALSSRCCSAR